MGYGGGKGHVRGGRGVMGRTRGGGVGHGMRGGGEAYWGVGPCVPRP